MSFIDDLTFTTDIHLVKNNDLRDLAIQNVWRGLLLAEKHANIQMRYCDRLSVVQGACLVRGEPIGERTIEKIVSKVKI
jgi:hypothetical protein